jgi:hypothetical protein
MQIDGYIQAVRDDLLRIAALGDESTARAAELLAVTLEASLGRRLFDALGEAALELSGQLEAGHVEVRVAGGDPELVYIPDQAPEPAAEPADEAFSARITLRLPETLKGRLELAAGVHGVSVNTLVVQMLSRAVDPRPSTSGGSRRRLTGYGRS